MLEGEAVARFAELRRCRPAMVAQMLGDDMAVRIALVKSFPTLRDPKHLAEPLLAMCLWHSYQPLRQAAAEAALQKDCRTPEVVDAQTDLAVEGIRTNRCYVTGGGEESRTPEALATMALCRTHPRQAAAKIFAATQEHRSYDDSAAVDLLVEVNEPRVIPLIVQRVGGDDSSRGDQGWMFAVLARMTQQSLTDYGVSYQTDGPEEVGMGRYTVADFDAAAKKVAAWWARNKERPEYRESQAPGNPVAARDGR